MKKVAAIFPANNPVVALLLWLNSKAQGEHLTIKF